MSELGLSGWIDTLEDRIVALEGNILALPTRSDISAFTSMIAGRLNTIDAGQASQDNKIMLLLQNFSNLKDTILNIDTNLLTISNNLSIHTGLTTGQGVHGHTY